MGIISLLQRIFGFTQNELKVIFFLTITFLAGVAIRWFKPLNQEVAQPDYSTEDSIFLERSKKLLQLASPESVKTTGKAATSKPEKPALQPHSIDINQASKDQIMLLPGIGQAYAERIIIYRTDHGPFPSVDALDRVKGIGKKTIERLRPFVTVMPPKEAEK